MLNAKEIEKVSNMNFIISDSDYELVKKRLSLLNKRYLRTYTHEIVRLSEMLRKYEEIKSLDTIPAQISMDIWKLNVFEEEIKAFTEGSRKFEELNSLINGCWIRITPLANELSAEEFEQIPEVQKLGLSHKMAIL